MTIPGISLIGATRGAESVGKDHSGCLVDHLSPGRVAGRAGGEPDLLQHAGGAEYVEWLAGLQTGERPPPLVMSGFVPVLLDLRQMIMDDCGDFRREVEGVTTEP